MSSLIVVPRILKRLALVGAIFLLAFFLSPNLTQAQSIANLICGPWRQVSAQPLGGYRDTLLDVAALSSDDVWAVGGSLPFATMTEHWDGFQWKLVASPNPGAMVNTLTSLTALAPDDIWAVGYQGNIGAEKNFVLHWDGAQWQQIRTLNDGLGNPVTDGAKNSRKVPIPDDGPQNFLYGSAEASDGLWAVGTIYWSCTFSGICHSTTFAMHQHGSNWLYSSTPNPSTGTNLLNGVAVVAADDVWVVGEQSLAVNGGTIGQTLIEHWDGTRWSVVPSPNTGLYHNSLFKVAAVAANDVWAVGYASGVTLIEHWDGTSWSIVPSPNAPSSFGLNLLTSLTVVNANDIYAVGWYLPDANANDARLASAATPDLISLTSSPLRAPLATNSISQPLVLHWDGNTWSLIPTPSVANPNALYGVTATRGNNRTVLAVGSYFSQPDYAMLPLALHLGPRCQNFLPFVLR